MHGQIIGGSTDDVKKKLEGGETNIASPD